MPQCTGASRKGRLFAAAALTILLLHAGTAQAAERGAKAPAAKRDAPPSSASTPREIRPPENDQAAAAPPVGDQTVVVYQPARTSAPWLSTAQSPDEREQRRLLLEETRALMATPAMQELIAMRMQGVVVTADTPGLTDEHRAALRAIADFAGRSGSLLEPPPAPPPPPNFDQ